MVCEHAVAEILRSFRTDDDILRTVLTLNRLQQSPIAPASLCTRDGKLSSILDLHCLVQQVQNILTFETYGRSFLPLIMGSTYVFVPWWGRDQLEIARDSSGHWHKELFVPKDMVLFHTEAGQAGRQVPEGEIMTEGASVSGGWDHEHCRLCWRTISPCEGDLNEGYTDSNEWLCESCYTKYIVSGFGSKLGERV